jgi:hypothetical protein
VGSESWVNGTNAKMVSAASTTRNDTVARLPSSAQPGIPGTETTVPVPSTWTPWYLQASRSPRC